MSRWNRINDKSNRAPKLEIHQAIWAMIGLGENGKEWSLEQKFEKIAEAGFTGVDYLIPEPAQMETWARLLEKYNLAFGALAFPSKPQDIEKVIKQAQEFGRVQFINSQVIDSFVIDQEAVHLLNDLMLVSEKSGIPHFIETHRGTITQDLIRTTQYVKELPQLRLTIDLSHFVVAGEIVFFEDNMEKPSVESHFDTLLMRTSAIHGRISSGEQVQVDIGENGEHPMVQHFKRWWLKGMKHWQHQAEPGDIFPFTCELGPPKYYAMTYRDKKGQEQEVSDRWQQALLFKRIAEEQWKLAQSS